MKFQENSQVSSSSKIILTGGSGLLGSEFRKIRPDIRYK